MSEILEKQLDSFNPEQRNSALRQLAQMADSGEIDLAGPTCMVNMHGHTFFSYNSYGYSPSRFAWLAKKTGLALAGIVDFDVLDGLDEFIAAGKLLGLKTCGGLETRVFVPEFADKVMTSPGEPGITYHMGVGFPSGALDPELKGFQEDLKDTARQRNCDLIDRVNSYLSPIEIDYEADVLPLTPSGNATERHITLAYARKAANWFGKGDKLAAFWSEKLHTPLASLDLPEGREILNTIRAKTMKQGGAGYVIPDAGAFPKMAQVNEFVLASGGIPTLTWLNGLSDGEQEIEKLIEIAMRTGVAAINIIPDRNFTPGVVDQKLKNLNHIIDLACSLDLPIVVGTEMNSPGQRFVDNFESAELAAHLPVFLKGAHIIYAHSVMQRQYGKGYCSNWAKERFQTLADKNEFFEGVGIALDPKKEDNLPVVTEDFAPGQILELINTR